MPSFNEIGNDKHIPTDSDFYRATRVTGSQDRNKDPLLVAIDDQLIHYHRRVRKTDHAEHFQALADLFMTVNAWIADAHGRSASTIGFADVVPPPPTSNTQKKGLLNLLGLTKSKKAPTPPPAGKTPFVKALPTSTKGARPPVDKKQFAAVLDLFAAVEQKLAEVVGTQDRQKLQKDLVRLIGKEVNDVGKATDEQFNAQMIKTASERSIHRLFIENGRIYRYNIDVDGHPSELTLLESGKFSDTISRPGAGLAMNGAAPFVMTLDRRFYMQKHAHLAEGGGTYHSSYIDGQPVAAAGTMVVRGGKLLKIRPDSGHYKPGDPQMANALKALKQLGISLDGVKVVSFDRSKTKRDAGDVINTPFDAPDFPGGRSRANSAATEEPIYINADGSVMPASGGSFMPASGGSIPASGLGASMRRGSVRGAGPAIDPNTGAYLGSGGGGDIDPDTGAYMGSTAPATPARPGAATPAPGTPGYNVYKPAGYASGGRAGGLAGGHRGAAPRYNVPQPVNAYNTEVEVTADQYLASYNA